MTTSELLESQIASDLEKLKSLPNGEEKEELVKNIEKLYKLKIEEQKANDEAEIKSKAVYAEIEKNDYDRQTKKETMAETRKTHTIDTVVEVVKIGVPALLYGVFLSKGFKFETDGVYSSKTFQNLLGKLNPFKK